jgi:hypothetical protein
MTTDEFLDLFSRLLPHSKLPKVIQLLDAARAVDRGESIENSARGARTTTKRLRGIVQASDRIGAALGTDPGQISDNDRPAVRQTLGQLLLGRVAERAFEHLYQAEMQPTEFELRDLRESRNDTDYRLHNGAGRPLYRINIKFHGSRFRRAPDLVGLQPEDCFALATYKIFSALEKQEQERLPYVFAIVGVGGLTAETVGALIPDTHIDAMALVRSSNAVEKKRNIEDAIVDYEVVTGTPVFVQTFDAIVKADWYILSARRADNLLREKLFDRVYALRVRGFAQQFRSAELDMHFSLAQDLTPLHVFFSTFRSEGLTKVATMLERGEF